MSKIHIQGGVSDEFFESAAYSLVPKHMKKRKGGIGKREKIEGLLMVSVPLIGFILFTALPILMTLWVSFYDLKSYDLSTMVWVGFGNYKKLFTMDLFWTAVVNTIYFSLCVPINLISQLFLANLLTKAINKTFSKIVRIILYVPTIIGGVAISLIFDWMLEPNYGVFNVILSAMGLPKVGFTTTFGWFMPSVLLIKWWSAGMNILVLQSALANVNVTLKEAASIDGASDRQIFFKIVIPQISPMLYYTFITEFIAASQEMSTVQMLSGTSGVGPGNAAVTLSYLMYRMAYVYVFTEGFGVSSALGILLGIVIIIFYQVNDKISKKWVSYD